MRRVLFVIVATTILAGTMASPALAELRGDWEVLAERHGEHAAFVRTWEKNYSQVGFYGGATYIEDSGIQFRLTYSIRCRGGFERSRTVVLVENPNSQVFRERTVSIPRPATQRRCVLEATATALSPWHTDVTIGIEAR